MTWSRDEDVREYKVFVDETPQLPPLPDLPDELWERVFLLVPDASMLQFHVQTRGVCMDWCTRVDHLTARYRLLVEDKRLVHPSKMACTFRESDDVNIDAKHFRLTAMEWIPNSTAGKVRFSARVAEAAAFGTNAAAAFGTKAAAAFRTKAVAATPMTMELHDLVQQLDQATSDSVDLYEAAAQL